MCGIGMICGRVPCNGLCVESNVEAQPEGPKQIKTTKLGTITEDEVDDSDDGSFGPNNIKGDSDSNDNANDDVFKEEAKGELEKTQEASQVAQCDLSDVMLIATSTILNSIEKRGPDSQVIGDESITVLGGKRIHVSYTASVLCMRGDTTAQPLISQDETVFFLYNGEIYDGLQGLSHQGNDTMAFFSQLQEAFMKQDAHDLGFELRKLLENLRGPWSMIFLDKKKGHLWFGRDYFGRRSLLMGISKTFFIITSVLNAPSSVICDSWIEIPACGLFCLDLNDHALISNFGQDDVEDDNGADDEVNSSGVSSSSNNTMQEAEHRTSRSSLKNVSIVATGNLAQSPHVKNISLSLYPWIRDDLQDRLEEAAEVLGQFNININILSTHSIPSPIKPFCSYLYPSSDNTRSVQEEVEVNFVQEKSEDSVNHRFHHHCEFPCGGENHVDGFLRHLRRSIKLRTISFESNVHQGASVGVLFSGGIDCMTIATLLDEILPLDRTIDLMNVAFENKKRKTAKKDDVYSVPDRITGIDSFKELVHLSTQKHGGKARKINFIKVDVTQEELEFNRPMIRSLIAPQDTVLDDSIGCAIWFASRGEGKLFKDEMDEECNEERFCSNARILLLGMGADEQLGGYGRHKSAWDKRGWEGACLEIKKDIERISTRNLGRDDRVVSDHGKEARYPFLDEDLVSFLNSLPVQCKMDLNEPRGVGEKKLLRMAARTLGIKQGSMLPKRAIQFGSRIAKMYDSNNSASDKMKRMNNK
eukprot:m.50826 g.50826  ORF g.50826 m.50826 type:complete len:758 (-) comp7536_c0_seq1:64-2337(-)